MLVLTRLRACMNRIHLRTVGCVAVLVAGVTWAYLPTVRLQKDEVDLTRLGEVMKRAAPGAHPSDLVRSVFPDGHLRSGGAVLLEVDPGFLLDGPKGLVIQNLDTDACKKMLVQGFVPFKMSAKVVWLNQVSTPLPADDVFCGPSGRARTPLTMEWKMR